MTYNGIVKNMERFGASADEICKNTLGVSAAALLHVSDNSVMNQSLMSSRASHGGREYRSFVRKEILPRIVHALFFE